MNASKEEAVKAKADLEKLKSLAELVEVFDDRVANRAAIERVEQFLNAAEKKLPTEESYKKDRQRKKRILNPA